MLGQDVGDHGLKSGYEHDDNDQGDECQVHCVTVTRMTDDHPEQGCQEEEDQEEECSSTTTMLTTAVLLDVHVPQ